VLLNKEADRSILHSPLNLHKFNAQVLQWILIDRYFFTQFIAYVLKDFVLRIFEETI